MTDVHVTVGIALVAANLAVLAYGGWAWTSGHVALPGYWTLVRLGQALVVVQATLGVILWASDHKLPDLHLIYGLTPLGVSLIAEQLRIVSAESVLDQRGLPDAQAVGALPEADQQAIVRAILRREAGVMAAAGGVIAVLGLRAAGWL